MGSERGVAHNAVNECNRLSPWLRQLSAALSASLKLKRNSVGNADGTRRFAKPAGWERLVRTKVLTGQRDAVKTDFTSRGLGNQVDPIVSP